MRMIFYMALLIGMLHSTVFAQKSMRGVWGAGGRAASSGTKTINGTLSQTAIGRSFSDSGGVRSGFWYTMRAKMPANKTGIIVVIPTFSGKAGATIEMPIIVESSVQLPFGRIWSFSGIFHFNATVLEPISGFDDYSRILDSGTVKFSGTSSDTAGIIKKITFRVKLGNEAISPVVWDSFTISQFPKATIVKKDGLFQLEDLCFTDGKPRLIGTLKQGLALSAYPLPAKGNLTIATSTVEKGNSEISMYSPDGKLIAIMYSGELNPGYHELPIDTEFIPSGSYILVLKTPSDMITTPCIIAK